MLAMPHHTDYTQCRGGEAHREKEGEGERDGLKSRVEDGCRGDEGKREKERSRCCALEREMTV